MTANDFISRWDAVVTQERAEATAAGVPEIADDLRLVTAPPALLTVTAFPSHAAHFLVEAGLPWSCAPFLYFDSITRGPIPLVQHYGTQSFPPADQLRLAPFFILGFGGAGNPLCLDSSRDGEIVVLDHENRFQTRKFVSSNIATLAEALLIVHTKPHEDFVEHVQSFDSRAAEPSAFLPTQVRMLID